MYFIIAMVSSLIYVVTYFSLRKHGRGISQQNQTRDRAFREEFVKTIIIVAFIQILTLIPAYIGAMVIGCSKSSALPSLHSSFFKCTA
jgi:hypothetical protein